MFLYGHTDISAIDYVADVTKLMKTCHERKRQELNAFGSLRTKINDETDMAIGVKLVKYKVLSDVYDAVALEYGIIYGITDEQRKIVGTLKAILGLFCAYAPRFSEVRLGCHAICFCMQFK